MLRNIQSLLRLSAPGVQALESTTSSSWGSRGFASRAFQSQERYATSLLCDHSRERMC